AILVTAVRATCEPQGPGSLLRPPASGRAWWWPCHWWRSLSGVFMDLWYSPFGQRQRFMRSSLLFALHDAVTRGRTHWVEQATDVGAVRPCRPLLRSLVVEAGLGAVGAQLSLEYMRSALGGLGVGSTLSSWNFLALGAAAGVARGAVVATGGQRPVMQTMCSWLEFVLEVIAERQGACLLGFRCPLPNYLAVVLWGIINFLPWGLLVVPCNRLVLLYFGEDPIVQQK
ncbi:unnamed protein product, partial [Polarella glacialis]